MTLKVFCDHCGVNQCSDFYPRTAHRIRPDDSYARDILLELRSHETGHICDRCWLVLVRLFAKRVLADPEPPGRSGKVPMALLVRRA
jgi:hypothetical protein